MAPAFRGPLTSPDCITAGYGLVCENRRLELYRQDPGTGDRVDRSLPVCTLDLHAYPSVSSGKIQQGLQWEIVLSATSPLATQQPHPDGSKPGGGLFRRQSSIGVPTPVERLSQSALSCEDPASLTSPAPSAAAPASSSSKSAAWLKSKLRSKSISASAAAPSDLPPFSASSLVVPLPQQPLPASPCVLGARNTPVPQIVASPSNTRQRISTSVENRSGSTTTKSPTSLVLFTISRDLQSQWVEALSAAVAFRPNSTTAVSDRIATPSSLPSLEVHTSPWTRLSSDLAEYAFPQRSSPSPLRMTATRNSASLSAQSATASPMTSFLEIGPEIGPPSSCRSPTLGSFRQSENGEGADSPRSSGSAYKRTPGQSNPLFPQWLSDVRRNSSGSPGLDDVQAKRYNRCSSPNALSPFPANDRMPSFGHLDRPPMRQSKSSSFLNLDPRRDRSVYSPSMGVTNSPFPDRGIKISIHVDEEEEHRQRPLHTYQSSVHRTSQPARIRRASARTHGSHDNRSVTPPIYINAAEYSSSSAQRNQEVEMSTMIDTSSEHLLTASQNESCLRPSLSSASLASNAASSLYEGGESLSSIAQSADPPTPDPPYIGSFGTPQSCELTPTYLSGGNSKAKLQGYFGVPREVIESQKELQTSSPSTKEALGQSELSNKVEKDHDSRMRMFTRIGAVFSGHGLSNQRSTVTSPTLLNSEDKDRESIRSINSSRFTSNSSNNNSKQSIISPISSQIDSASTSRKSSYDRPACSKSDIGRHIIDPAELRRLTQERLDSPNFFSSNQLRTRPYLTAGSGMKKSVSMQASLDYHAKPRVTTREDLLAPTSTSPYVLDYQKGTSGRVHPVQAPSTSYSPLQEGLQPRSVSARQPAQPRMPRSDSANSVNVQALFATLPPPKRRPAGTVRPSTASDGLPSLQKQPCTLNTATQWRCDCRVIPNDFR